MIKNVAGTFSRFRMSSMSGVHSGSGPSSARRAKPQTTNVKARLNVAVFIFDGVQILDYAGPYETFSSSMTSDGPAFNVYTVAEKAGVSVGSLYQYFPNKQSILYRLQIDEWHRTGNMLDAILARTQRSPALRMRDALRAFFESEIEEAPLRSADNRIDS